MKELYKGILIGSIGMSVLIGVAALAENAYESISVLPNTVKVMVGDKLLTADNFLYKDTTYLPIRAVSEALGKDVQYDNTTSTAYIKEKGNEKPMEIKSKYTPPQDIINDTNYIQFEDGVYYVTGDYIGTKHWSEGYTIEWIKEGDYGAIMKDEVEIIRFPLVRVAERGCIPYDTYVDEILPLLEQK